MAGELLTSAQAKELGVLEQERSLHENRVARYGLGELVWDLKFQEFSNYKIAQACNAKLMDRIKGGDNNRYIVISTGNVEQYLRTAKMEMEKSPTNTTDGSNLAIVKAHEQVMGKLNKSVSILENEIEKLRNIDTPVLETRAGFFLQLMQEIRANIELMAKIQGQIQPAISLNIFSQNIDRLCNRIDSETTLTNDVKRCIMNMIAETITADLVGKPVDYREIKDERVGNQGNTGNQERRTTEGDSEAEATEATPV